MTQQQATLKDKVTLAGIGLHSGQTVTLELTPNDSNTGIVFCRSDLPGCPRIVANPFHVEKTPLCTRLVSSADSQNYVMTIEHLMSALCAFGIDNVLITIDGPEVPVIDGSAKPFCDALSNVGLKTQQACRRVIEVLKPVRVEHDGKVVTVHPVEQSQTSYAFEIYWDHPVIANTPSQISWELDYDGFIKEIAPARTFGFIDQIEALQSQGLALGASLNNAIGITDGGIKNAEGLRFKDEFVRHKLLDAIGDFYVAGPILGHFDCYCSGHSLNNALLRTLLSDETAWQIKQ